MILVGMTYINVFPVVLPFLLLFLAFGYVINRYLLFYVYKQVTHTHMYTHSLLHSLSILHSLSHSLTHFLAPLLCCLQDYDSGGLIWPRVFNQLMACVIISQVAVAAVLFVKGLLAQAICLLLLVCVTGVMWFQTNAGRGSVGNELALEFAVGTDSSPPEHLAEAYEQPELKEPSTLHASTLDLTTTTTTTTTTDNTNAATSTSHQRKQHKVGICHEETPTEHGSLPLHAHTHTHARTHAHAHTRTHILCHLPCTHSRRG